MKVKMTRSIGRSRADVQDGQEERLEGQVYDLPAKEAQALVKRGLAEPVGEPERPQPAPEAVRPREERPAAKPGK